MPRDEAEKLLSSELTTVTKRLRRVFTFSFEQVRQAARINGATKICLNFADYLDWRVRGVTSRKELLESFEVAKFIGDVEQATQVPVTMVGTGPRITDTVWFD